MGEIQRVVVIDHDEEMSFIVSAILEGAGYDVITLHRGADALSFLARSRSPCIVLLDPRVADGWEFLSMVRALQARSHSVVLMISNGDRHPPRDLPALQKPFSARQLLGAVALTT